MGTATKKERWNFDFLLYIFLVNCHMCSGTSFQPTWRTSLFGLKHKLGQKSELNKVTWRSQNHPIPAHPRANKLNFSPACGASAVCAHSWRACSTRSGLGWTDGDWASWRTGSAVMLWRGVWCDEEDGVVAGRWRARMRERRVSHLALASLMERGWVGAPEDRTRGGPAGQWGAVLAASAPAVSPPLLGCDRSDSKFGKSTETEFHACSYGFRTEVFSGSFGQIFGFDVHCDDSHSDFLGKKCLPFFFFNFFKAATLKVFFY